MLAVPLTALRPAELASLGNALVSGFPFDGP